MYNLSVKGTVHSTMQDQPEENTGQNSNCRYPHYFRILICLAAVAALINAVNWSLAWHLDALPPAAASMAILLLVYAAATYQACRRAGTYISRICRFLPFVDAALIGITTALLEFSPLPLLSFIALVQLHAFSWGGLYCWLEQNAGLLAGLGTGYLICSPSVEATTSPMTSAASLIGVFVYVFAYAFHTRKQIACLREANHALIQDQRTSKMRTYKLSKYLPQRLWARSNHWTRGRAGHGAQVTDCFLLRHQGFQPAG